MKDKFPVKSHSLDYSLGISAATAANGVEEDFLDIISKFQGNRLDDQRTEMPATLLKQQNLKLESVAPISNGFTHQSTSSTTSDEEKEKEPIKAVLESGAPYPMIVLPVEGDYWMEGTYHILSRDMYDRPIFPTIDRSRCSIEDDQSVYSYRKNFAGKEHTNYVGNDSKHGPILMSVLLEQDVNNKNTDKSSSSPKLPQQRPSDRYRVILRVKNKTIDKTIPANAFPTDYPGPGEIMKYVIEDEVDVDRFHPVVVPRASEDITRFDEHSVSNCYKIGVLHQKHGQISEEEYLQNPEETPALREFLDLIADRVELKDFPHYRGGLDVKHGQTGEHSYYTNFKDREVMFHVSSMIPYKPNDSQQLSRKRHIGNDVVSIVFQEENTPFCPNSIRSHFLHCFVVVQVENPNTDQTHYKVSITAKEGVPKFAPSLPNPCIFKKGEDFREFLLTKILNAENAAVKSDKFSALAERTRSMLLQGIVSEFITKNEKMLEDDHLSNGSEHTDSHHVKSGSILSTFRSALNRSSRNDQDTASISSASTSSITNLNVTKSSGQSLSLNDLNNIDGVEDSSRRDTSSVSPKLKKHKKDKEKSKKEKAKNTIISILPHHSQPLNDISPVLHAPEQYNNSTFLINSTTKEQATDNERTRCRSKFFANHLFDKPAGSGSIGSDLATQSLPRNHRMNSEQSDAADDQKPAATIQRISIMPNSDEENNNAGEKDGTSLAAAQVEIDKLKAEINKLKMDKMNLIRQNVVHQQAIKKLNERTDDQVNSISPSRSTSDLRSLSLKHSYNPRKLYKATTFAEFV